MIAASAVHASNPVTEFGVYVHIPFCSHRCDYCDFATWTDRSELQSAYVAACIADLRSRVARGSVPLASSVFFGGGTPSLLPPADLMTILAEIPLADGAEVTVECNPDSIDSAGFDVYLAGGVNRLSFGVQSLDPQVLMGLGRTHNPENVTRVVAAARTAGFTNFNLDLIYGTPSESREQWTATVHGALELEPPHLSMYALTVEPGTPLGARVREGAPGPDDDDQAAKYEAADEIVSAAGMNWYEISNWSRPGFECRHNLLHWATGNYLAIGCAAHGHDHGRRYWNLRTPERYIAAIENGESPESGAETLDAATRRDEEFALALRTRFGASAEGIDPLVVSEMTDAGLLHIEPALDATNERLILSRRGRLLATEVTVRLLAENSAGTRYDGVLIDFGKEPTSARGQDIGLRSSTR